MRTLAIDPGPTESAWVVIDDCDCEPQLFGKIPNDHLRRKLILALGDIEADRVVVEMVASYGMAVGAEVFDTCVWIGRFCEAVRYNWYPHSEPALVKRQAVKVHHCHSAKAKDSNIVQALVDRFAPGEPNFGKGTKAKPGFFYGFSADVWQAFALAVYAADESKQVPF